jgi:hypothetical protein
MDKIIFCNIITLPNRGNSSGDPMKKDHGTQQDTIIDRFARLSSRSRTAPFIPAGFLTSMAASPSDALQRINLPKLSPWQSGVRSVDKRKPQHPTGQSVHIVARHTILQLRVQCTTLAYFPFTRMRTSGTGTSKRTPYGNDFLEGRQRLKRFFRAPDGQVNKGKPTQCL